MNLNEIREIASPLCRDFNVKRLDVFGSFARNAVSSNSDVDLLVEFRDPEQHLSKRFFGLLHGLEDALGRSIDLITPNSLRNPYFKKRVLNEKVPVYEG